MLGRCRLCESLLCVAQQPAYQAEVHFIGMDALPSFVRTFEGNGYIERDNHRPPAHVRQDLLGTGAAA
jgi:hypothetical protein